MRAHRHTPGRAPFVSPSRAAGIAAGDARKAWLTVLREAARLAALVEAGGSVSAVEGAPFAGLALRLTAASFPVRAPKAAAAAEAFLILARGAVASAWPVRLAPFVEAGARCLAALIDEDTRAAFAASCRAAGGED